MNQAELEPNGAPADRPTNSKPGGFSPSKSDRPPLWADALVLFGLSSLAIAQPLFDVLGRAAEFFIASRTKPLDLALLVILFCLIIPGLLFGVELLFGLLGQRVRGGVHLLFVGLLSALIALPPVKRLGGLPLPAVLLAATVVGVAIGLIYLRLRPVRLLLAWFGIAALVVPANFIFNTGAARILFSKRTTAVPPRITARAPVVMVIFDELPLTSLLTERNQIDPVRYPNFAALSTEACWFRNATCVTSVTVKGIPSIVSGNYPKNGLMPTSEDYPHTLFTLLGGAYEMHVMELSTHLCPDQFGAPLQASSGFGERMRKLLADVAIVYGHIVLPEAWAARLPSVADQWNDFAARGERPAGARAEIGAGGSGRKIVPGAAPIRPTSRPTRNDRRALFAEFVGSIKPSDRPALYFAHAEIPHPPFQYLPSGKVYALNRFVNEGQNNFFWQKDLAPVLFHYQRHLLQVGFADKLLGDLLAKLKDSGLYDPALVVVMSDHGVSFIPGDRRRSLSETNSQDILPVPLFIKLPRQREGIISDRPVETIDVLPTIADRLEISLPWTVDGRSAFDPAPAGKVIKTESALRKAFAFSIDRTMEAIKRKTELFGGDCAWDRLFSVGPYRNLIHRRLEDLVIDSRPAARFELDNVDDYAAIDPHSDYVPVRIRGRILPDESRSGPFSLAIAVNRTIRAMTETFPWRGKQHWFVAMVPEDSFQPGANSIEIFLVTGPEERPHLQLAQLQRSAPDQASKESEGRR